MNKTYNSENKIVLPGTSRIAIGGTLQELDAWWGDASDDFTRTSPIALAHRSIPVLGPERKIMAAELSRISRQPSGGAVRCLHLEDGSELHLLPSSRLYVYKDGWKPEVQLGDLVGVPKRLGFADTVVGDHQIALLMAWQISEGYEENCSKTVNITQSNRQMLERVRGAASQWSFREGVDMNSMPIYDRKGKYVLAISSYKYCAWLEEHGYEWGHKSAPETNSKLHHEC
jgi:hypothetical protein